MKVDTSKLKEAMGKYKSARKSYDLPKHEAWVPAPEKERAKEMGVRWNSQAMRHEFAAAEPASHPCARYLPSNYQPLSAPIPFEVKDDFKQLGIVTQKDAEGKWTSYVMLDEDYVELVEALQELELL